MSDVCNIDVGILDVRASTLPVRTTLVTVEFLLLLDRYVHDQAASCVGEFSATPRLDHSFACWSFFPHK